MALPDNQEAIKRALEYIRKYSSGPKKFSQILNQAPRSPAHGKHRRPSPTAHRDPADGAGACTGSGVFTWTIGTKLPPASWRTINTSQSPGAGAGLTLIDYVRMISIATINIDEPAKPTTIPYAGIRAGEIIGHRAWWVIDGKLCSLVHYHIWEPGQTQLGDVDKLVNGSPFVQIWGGIYAYSKAEQVVEHCYKITRNSPCWPHQSAYYTVFGLVWGTVKLWGEVIEHQTGYRAQFAKVASLDGACGLVDLDQLRKDYGV